MLIFVSSHFTRYCYSKETSLPSLMGKVYGPHLSAMYVRKTALETSVQSIIHHFLSPAVDSIGYKLQPAGPGYELTWVSTAVLPYLKSLTTAGTLQSTYEAMSAHDSELATMILGYLTSEKVFSRGVRIVGSGESSPERMPTISFLVTAGSSGEPGMKSKEVVGKFDKRGLVCLLMLILGY
jgi:hypothetical protein